MNDLIRRVTEIFDFDRASFMQYSKKLGDIYATHSYAREGLPKYFALSGGEGFITKEYGIPQPQLARAHTGIGL